MDSRRYLRSRKPALLAPRAGTPEFFAFRPTGKREIIRQQGALSRPTRWGGRLHQTRTLSEQHAVEDAVMASEIEQLPDISGSPKVASNPEWRRVTVSRSKRAAVKSVRGRVLRRSTVAIRNESALTAP
jgi:hypothetical protein